MSLLKIDTTFYHTQFRLQDEGRAVKGLVVCIIWDLEPLDLPNRLALGGSYEGNEVAGFFVFSQ